MWLEIRLLTAIAGDTPWKREVRGVEKGRFYDKRGLNGEPPFLSVKHQIHLNVTTSLSQSRTSYFDEVKVSRSVLNDQFLPMGAIGLFYPLIAIPA